MKIKKRIKTIIGCLLPSRILTKNGIIHVPINVIAEIKSKILIGTYEYAEIKLLKKYIKKTNSVIELGGSIGVVTKQIQKKINKENIIITVEANPKMLTYIDRNTSKSDKYARLYIENAAVCNAEEVYFDISDLDTRNNKINVEGKLLIKGTNVTKILHKYSLNNCTLVVDVEGEEHNLFMYDAAAFEKINDLFIELHGEAEQINATLKNIESLGFIKIEQIHQTYYFTKL